MLGCACSCGAVVVQGVLSPRPADLQAIIDAGLGDKPLKDLRLRCAKCGSRMTDAVMMGRGGVGVQPWRSEAG